MTQGSDWAVGPLFWGAVAAIVPALLLIAIFVRRRGPGRSTTGGGPMSSKKYNVVLVLLIGGLLLVFVILPLGMFLAGSLFEPRVYVTPLFPVRAEGIEMPDRSDTGNDEPATADESLQVVSVDSVQRDRAEGGASSITADRRVRTRRAWYDSLGGQWCRPSGVLGCLMRVGAFCLLLVLAYLFVDAGRRPRYTWRRRMTIAAAFIAVCVFVWRFSPAM
jgi:hypothetical protein